MIDMFPVEISSFKLERNIRVFLPEKYDEVNDFYPVLYMHDGQNVFNDSDAIGGVSLHLEKYLLENKIDLIVVAIDQNSIDRKNEYCPWENGEFSRKLVGKDSTFGGKGKDYIDFIVNELKPLIDRKYRTLIDENMIAGISLGGLISSYAICAHPTVFKKIAVMSAAFYANQEKMEELLHKADLSNCKGFYMDCGTMEAGENTFVSNEFLASNQAIYEMVKKKVPNTKFNVVINGEHRYEHFKNRVEEFITFLISETKIN